MNASQLRLWLAAPMASLFLVLSLCAFAMERTSSTGIYIPLLRLHRSTQAEFSCDGRFIFVQLRADGTTWINEESIPFEQLRARLTKLMENRAEPVAFLVPESDISYPRFIYAVDAMRKASSDMHIGVLSGKLRNEYLQTGKNHKLAEPRYVPCDIIWPSHESEPHRR
jgi:biopolymer transport protein ExbD